MNLGRSKRHVKTAPAFLALVLLLLSGCLNLVTKEFQMYDGPRLAKEKVATLACVLNVRVEIDEKGNVNSETSTALHVGEAQKWGGRYELLPGKHKVIVSPYPSFLGGGYAGLPGMLPECTLVFEAEANRRYSIQYEQMVVDKSFAAKAGDTTTFIVNNISYTFFIRDEDTRKAVSTGSASLKFPSGSNG